MAVITILKLVGVLLLLGIIGFLALINLLSKTVTEDDYEASMEDFID